MLRINQVDVCRYCQRSCLSAAFASFCRPSLSRSSPPSKHSSTYSMRPSPCTGATHSRSWCLGLRCLPFPSPHTISRSTLSAKQRSFICFLAHDTNRRLYEILSVRHSWLSAYYGVTVILPSNHGWLVLAKGSYTMPYNASH